MDSSHVLSRSEILTVLGEHASDLNARFGVSSLALFGSASRDALAMDSDVDIVVRFEGPATLDGYFDLKFFLESLLGRSVDLATEQMVKPGLRRRIEGDLIYVT